ncbi:unnamed protein product [Ixodes persulcatus]
MVTPSKAQAFTFEVPQDTPVDAIITGFQCIIGADILHHYSTDFGSSMRQEGPRFQAVVSSMANSGEMVAQVVLRFGKNEVPLAPVGPHDLDVSVFRLPPCAPDKALLAV